MSAFAPDSSRARTWLPALREWARNHERFGRIVPKRGLRAFTRLAATALLSLTAHTSELHLDFSRTNGVIRPLHGGNNGPLGYGELVDLTPYFRELAVPVVRLHDSAWPYPDLVDIHAVFPDFHADPARPESYRFGPTDDYLRAITNAGARIVYRLGESIEHAKRKRYVHPPPDPEKWAQICLGIIRHYNEGWADGLRLGISHWEIWNEPENRPAMWTGTPDQYYALYSTTAKAIKGRWPELKVGGPSLGHQGEYRDGRLIPSEFLKGFIEHLRREKAPLDFFSWHLYTSDPREPARRGRAVRAFLDETGFRPTESHLNEWNFLPDNDWAPMTAAQGATREQWYARQGGMEGAVFAAAVLAELQTAPVDAANFYSTDNQPFGLFTLHGAPKKTFHAFKAFREMLNTPTRIGPEGGLPEDITLLAGLDAGQTRAQVLISHSGSQPTNHLTRISGVPWPGPIRIKSRIVDERHNLEPGTTALVNPDSPVLPLTLEPRSVVLLEFSPARE